MPTSHTSHSILARYSEGERSFTSLDLDDKNYDFTGATLVEVDFSECFLTATFRGADLRRAVFKNANVKTCDFTDANLAGASFEGSAIDAAGFEGANLAAVSFIGASEQGHVYQAGELPI